MMLRSLAPILLGAVVGTTVGACFDAPRPAVQFSCDLDEAPQCPPDYTCQPDGCCHLDGTDFAEHEGECQIAGAVATEGPLSTGVSATDSGSTAVGSSSDGASTDATGVATGATDGSTGGASESGSSSGDGGSGTSAETGSTGGLGPR